MKYILLISKYHGNIEMAIGAHFIDFERHSIKTYTAKSIVDIEFSILQPKILRGITKINKQLYKLLDNDLV